LQELFFARQDDLIANALTLEQSHALNFVRAEVLAENSIQVKSSLASFLDVCVCSNPHPAVGPTFLIFELGVTIRTRDLGNYQSKPRYAIDQLINPDTVVLTSGGIYKQTNIVLRGTLGANADSAPSKSLFKILSKSLFRGFTKKKNYWIGPGALSIHQGGGRLATISAESLPEYDLK
jgi:hypothetical protein